MRYMYIILVIIVLKQKGHKISIYCLWMYMESHHTHSWECAESHRFFLSFYKYNIVLVITCHITCQSNHDSLWTLATYDLCSITIFPQHHRCHEIQKMLSSSLVSLFTCASISKIVSCVPTFRLSVILSNQIGSK